ncbi:MAG: site-specific integrase, partial [Clostridiales bacterium]|nr:site-specific integrase [Clostridiales bacterium]
MKMDRMIALFMDYCQSKRLRPKTMQSYEQSLRLFEAWLKDTEQITEVEHIREATLRSYMLDLQSRGKYTACADNRTKLINHPQNRGDYNGKITNITINNYLRNLRVFFS